MNIFIIGQQVLTSWALCIGGCLLKIELGVGIETLVFPDDPKLLVTSSMNLTSSVNRLAFYCLLIESVCGGWSVVNVPLLGFLQLLFTYREIHYKLPWNLKV